MQTNKRRKWNGNKLLPVEIVSICWNDGSRRQTTQDADALMLPDSDGAEKEQSWLLEQNPAGDGGIFFAVIARVQKYTYLCD